MKAIILAGGHATRLHPTTQVVNKHLLNIYDMPMIFYPIITLRDAGIKDIVISLGDHDTERFYDLLGSGASLGVNLEYDYHGKPLGIAYAINHIQYEFPEFLEEPFVVHLGDNIFCDGLDPQIRAFRNRKNINMFLTKQMPWNQARNYGVFINRKFIEKPIDYKPFLDVVLGVYFLTPTFFRAYKVIEPSNRGEYEIMHIYNQFFVCEQSKYGGKWFDCGTFDDILEASIWRRSQSSVQTANYI